jgi:hypothetical protein
VTTGNVEGWITAPRAAASRAGGGGGGGDGGAEERERTASFDLWAEGKQSKRDAGAGCGGRQCLLDSAGASRRATQRCSGRGAWWHSWRALLQQVGWVQRAKSGRREGVCCGRDGGNLGAVGWLQRIVMWTVRGRAVVTEVTQAGRA